MATDPDPSAPKRYWLIEQPDLDDDDDYKRIHTTDIDAYPDAKILGEYELIRTPVDSDYTEASALTPLALEYFKPPFKYDALGQTVYCINTHGHEQMALQVRGWGNLVGGGANNLPREKAEHIQDEFGEWAAAALNAFIGKK